MTIPLLLICALAILAVVIIVTVIAPGLAYQWRVRRRATKQE